MTPILHRLLAQPSAQLPAGPLTVLEAGCGSANQLPWEILKRARVTGLDISPAQLDRHRGLAERLWDDLQTVEFDGRTWTVVVCWNVLEHLSRPVDALDRLCGAVSPGGLLILGFPNLISFKGLATRFTPHAAHVAFYRWVRRVPDAGTGDKGPFPTFLRWSIRPGAVAARVRGHGFETVVAQTYDGFSSKLAVNVLHYTTRCVAAVLTLGMLGASETVQIHRRRPTL